MASIGGYTMLRIDGEITPLGETVEEVTYRGRDGHAYRKLGEAAPVSQIVSTVDAFDGASVSTLVYNYKALQGTAVVIATDGVTTAQAIVLGVELLEVRPILNSVGGEVSGSTRLVVCRWEVQAV